MYGFLLNAGTNVKTLLVGNPDFSRNMLSTFAILFILIIFQRSVRFVISKRVKNDETLHTGQKILVYFTVLVGALLIGRTWFQGMESLATFLGLFTAGLAIAMKDMVANFVGWIYLFSRKHFQVGDRIQIEDIYGDVIDIGIQSFTIMEIQNWVDADQSTGRLVEVPLSTILTKPAANYSKGFPYIWHEIPVTITFESDWKLAKSLLEDIVNRYHEPRKDLVTNAMRLAKRHTLVSYSKLTPAVYVTISEHGVQLTLRFLCNIRQRRNADQELIEQILEAFARPDIHFAYTTMRIYKNPIDHSQPSTPHSVS